MTLRRQLPVYSPIRFASLVAGVRGALGLGRPRARLRELLAGHFGTTDLLLTDSGTTALQLAIRGALEVAPAVEAGEAAGRAATVALPAYCCYDVATAAIGAGARVRLYDIDPDTLGPDWDSLEEALRAGAAAVVVVHLYGIPVDMQRAADLARDHGALVIEDAAQGIGGSIDGRPLGSIGSLGVLSFGRGKGVTGGGGGALLANDEAGRAVLGAVRDRVAPGARGWGEVGRLAAQWLLGRPSIYGLPASLPWLGLGETRYREPRPPGGIARGAAAALLANWDASLAEAEERRDRGDRLCEGADDARTVRVPGHERGGALGEAGALRLPLLMPEPPGALGRAVDLARGGFAPGYPRPLDQLPALGSALADERRCPGAALLAGRLWTAPTHSKSDPSRTVDTLALLS